MELKKNKIFKLISIFLLLWASFWLIYNALSFSLTSDETVYVPAGYRAITKGDIIINNEHPPLNKLLSGLFVMPFKPDIDKAINETPDNNQWQLGDKFWFESGNDYKPILLIGRVPTLILTILMMVSVLLFFRSKYGWPFGVGGLATLALNPNILSHGALSNNDLHLVIFAWFLFIATYNLIKKYSPRNIILWGLALGFIFLAKFSGPFFAIISILFVFFHFLKSKGLVDSVKLIVFGGILIIACLWPSYFILERKTLLSDGSMTVRTPIVGDVNFEKVITKSTIIPIFRYWEGYVVVKSHNDLGHNSYLNGEIRSEGFRSYFVWSLWYKTPIVILVMTAIGLFIALKERRRLILTIALIAILYLILASIGRIHIGVRHVLPVYLGFAPLVGLAVTHLLNNKFGKTLIILFIAILALDLYFNSPNKISYFSMASGGNQDAYKKIADSNLDWGQESDLLINHLKRNEYKNLIIAQANGVRPEYVGITDYRKINDYTCGSFPENAAVIMSVNYIIGLLGPYHCAITALESGKAERLGHSYYIFEGKDLN